MALDKSLDLEPIIKDIAYEKSLTMTSTEIRQAINEALLTVGIEYVSTLPTGNNIKQRVYLVPDQDGETDDMCTVWVYDFTNNRWEEIDHLKFNINDYSKIADIIDNLTSNATDKPLSANQGKVLKALVDSKEDTSNKVTSVSNESTDMEYPSAKLLYDQLALKSDSTHDHDSRYIQSHQDITGKVNVSDIADNLTTDSNSKVLSAKQGKNLNESKAPNDHKSPSTTYGVGDTTNYGHVKVDDTLSDSSTNPIQNKKVKESLDSKENTSNKVTSISSSSTDTEYPTAKLLYDTTRDGTFTELSTAISDAITNNNGVLFLDKNYKATNTDTLISLTANLTIYGNGHTIDGSNQIMIFNAGNYDFSLNDLHLINAYRPSSSGGAIYGGTGNLTVNNCIFENNYADYGSCIRSGGTLTITNSSFINNTQGNNGVIFNTGNSILNMENCSFINNKSTNTGGGAINTNQLTGIIKNCIFQGNSNANDHSVDSISSTNPISVINCTIPTGTSYNVNNKPYLTGDSNVSKLLDSNAHSNLETSANATQAEINSAIDAKIAFIMQQLNNSSS